MLELWDMMGVGVESWSNPYKVGDIHDPLRSRDHFDVTKLGEPDARGAVGLATGSMFQI